MKRYRLKGIVTFWVLVITGLISSCLSNTLANQIDPTITTTSGGVELSTLTPRKVTGIALFSKFIDQSPFNQGGLDVVNPDNNLAFFDIDLNKITNSDEADLYLAVGCGSGECNNLFIALNRFSGTMVVKAEDMNEPSYQGCNNIIQKETGTIHAVSGRPLIGSYFCVKTNKGNIAQLHIISNEQQGVNAKVVFDYIIWSRDN
jgi:hypothetical protein